MPSALAPEQALHHAFGSQLDPVGRLHHRVAIIGVRLVPPFRVERNQPSRACDDEVVDVAGCKGDAVDPIPDDLLPLGSLQFVARVLLTPGAAQMEDRFAVVRDEGGPSA